MTRLLYLLALAAPAAVTAALVAAHAVNVPFWDQWELVLLLDRQAAGTLAFADVFHQHNEHRMLFPTLVMLALAPLTGWDIRAELAVNLALAAGALAVVLAMLRPVLAGAGERLRLWAALFAALLVFSPAQWENWLWGWQIQWFLSLLATLAAVALLARALAAANPWPALAAAAAAVAVVQFSVASGVGLWAAGLLMIALHPRERRLPLAGAWMAAALLSSALFFADWRSVPIPGAPTPLEMLRDPATVAAYVGNYLAGALARGTVAGAPAYGLGWMLIAAVAGFALYLLATGWRERAAVLPWLALAAFAGANALATALGRAGFGVDQALGSRYVTLGLLFPLAAVALGVLALRRMAAGGRGAARAIRAGGVVLAAMVTVLLLLAGLRSLTPMESRAQQLATGRACVLTAAVADDDCLRLVYPSAAVVRERAAILERLGWSGFRQVEAAPGAGTADAR